MQNDIRHVRKYLQKGDVVAIARSFDVTKQFVHKVMAGTSTKIEITLAILHKAEQRKKEAEEIERLQQSL